jgi:hypothetical protein
MLRSNPSADSGAKTEGRGVRAAHPFADFGIGIKAINLCFVVQGTSWATRIQRFLLPPPITYLGGL